MTIPFCHLKCNDNAADETVVDYGSGDNDCATADADSYTNTENLSTTTAKVNRAFDFDGANEWLYCNPIIATVASDSVGSVSFWVRLDTLEDVAYIWGYSQSDATDNHIYFNVVNTMDPPGYNFHAYLMDDGTTEWGWWWETDLAAETWYHITMIQTGTGMQFYTNASTAGWTQYQTGADDAAWYDDIGSADTYSFGTLWILSGTAEIQTGNCLDGQIDDVRIYRSAISTAEISYIYKGGSGTEGQGDVTVSPSVLTSTVSVQSPLLVTEFPVASVASTISLNSPAYTVTKTPAAQELALTENDPANYLVTMFPDVQELDLTLGEPTPVPVDQMYDPEVTAGCPQCGTLLYPGKEMFSEAVKHGKHMDDDDDEYVRCARCGFPIRVSRHRVGVEGGRQGWGMVYTLYDRTTGL